MAAITVDNNASWEYRKLNNNYQVGDNVIFNAGYQCSDPMFDGIQRVLKTEKAPEEIGGQWIYTDKSGGKQLHAAFFDLYTPEWQRITTELD